MARVVNFVKTIRNNWKKSIFGAAALSYGVSYGTESYNTDQLMRQYCENAVKFGDEPIPVQVKPRHVTVILNPMAGKSKAKKLFEKHCAPLLHLAGIAVTIIQTQSEGEARSLITNLNTPTDAIIVAGGDGTLSDVVTGLMRKYNCDYYSIKNCPIGILPLGRTNTIADSLFHKDGELADVRQMVDATMAILKADTKLLDVVQIEPIEEDLENPIKPVYALGRIQWGAWRDAHVRMDKYWYLGSLRKYATYIFNGYKRDITWVCNAKLRYTDPCKGCSRCYQQEKSSTLTTMSNRRWWHAFIPRSRTFSSDTSHKSGDNTDYSKIVNENCGIYHEVPISATELEIITINVPDNQEQSMSLLKIQLGPENVDYSSFVREGWSRAKKNKTLIDRTYEAKEIELLPENKDKDNQSRMFSIDNEEFEVMPVKIKLLPRSVKVFCPESIGK